MFKIIMQDEGRGENKKKVPVKRVRYFPFMKDGAITGWSPIAFLLITMKLKKGNKVYSLTWSAHSGFEGRWSFRKPDYQGPTYQKTTGTGRIATRNGVKIIDPTKPLMTYKGEVTSYGSKDEMAVDLLKMTGRDMAIKIIKLFAAKISEERAGDAEKAKAMAA